MHLCPSLRAAVWLAVLTSLVSASPCRAWLYDGGPEQHAAVSVAEGTNCVWVAQPFVLTSDCWATTFGAGIGRFQGPTDAGFDVYITTTLDGLPGSAMFKLPQPLVPKTAGFVYYYETIETPLFLNKDVAYAMVLMPSNPGFGGMVSLSAWSGYYGLGTGDYGQSWYYLARPLCVRLDGYPVPEPASISLLLVGLCSIGLLRKRC